MAFCVLQLLRFHNYKSNVFIIKTDFLNQLSKIYTFLKDETNFGKDVLLNIGKINGLLINCFHRVDTILHYKPGDQNDGLGVVLVHFAG